jgi:hypothetical protein
MRKRLLLAGVLTVAMIRAVPALAGGSEAEFQTALAAAEAANKEAGALKNQWTTTAQEIAAAKKAASAGEFDKGASLARAAEALARASIAQAKEQATAWRDVEIH